MTFDFKNEIAELLLGKQPVLELFEPEVEIEVELPDLEVKPLPLPLPLPLPVNPDFEIPDLDSGMVRWVNADLVTHLLPATDKGLNLPTP